MHVVGKIIGTHGVKGYLKVKSETDFFHFQVKEKIYINKTSFILSNVQKLRNFFLIKLENIDTLNEVESFKGFYIYVQHLIYHNEKNSYRYQDLINKPVFNKKNRLLGITKDIRTVPQGYLLEIKTDNGDIKLVPFIDIFIKEITSEKIIIEPIEGLI